MADFTGFDPAAAKQQLEQFSTFGKIVYEKATKAYYDFFQSLKDNWCSPKAVEFTTEHLFVIHAFSGNIATMYMQIYRSAVDAYNIIARAQGESAMALEDQNEWYSHYNDDMGGEILKEANENGIVGMNVANVQLARDIYLTQMNEIITAMENTPLDIAFYDPGDAQKTAYKNEITTRVNDMNEKINTTVKALNEAMETETNTIMIAKDNAAGTMSA